MPRMSQRSESKRKLFHSITSRMSHSHFHHNRDDSKDDIKETSHSPYNDSTNTYNGATINNNDNNNNNNNNNGNNTSNTYPQEELTYSTYLKQHNASSLPITQGSDNTSFSYLDSIKKAPTKKRHSQPPTNNEIKTPTLNLKVRNNKIRNILSNSSNIINNTNHNTHSNTSDKKKDHILNYNACSPVAETSENSDISFLSKTDSLIINNNTNDDINEYDYKTFSSNHPIRFSKVKAFEQAEMTSKMYFSKFIDDGDDHDHKGNSQNDEIIIQIPQLAKNETKSLLGYENPDMNNPSGITTVERRIYLMKNALKPATKEQLIQKKLRNSDLPQTFSNSGAFLDHLEPEELDLWELMNDEFETSLKELQRDYRQELVNQHTLADKQQQNFDPKFLSALVCRRVKEVLQEEDKFVLNHR